MADDNSPSGPSTAATAAAAPSPSQHAQAVRFLTSLRAQRSTSTVTEQRDFLRSKGLNDAQIDAAFADAVPPEGLAGADAAPPASANDEDPFDRAARAFDDPIHAPPGADVASLPSAAPELPAKSYPRSPLALYTSQAEVAAANAAGQGQQAAVAQQTRYEVLLGFFRSLSYMLVLGGGVTAVAVALYRTYMLPRLVSTLSARSSLLKHHHANYSDLLGSVRSLHSNSLVPEADRIQVLPNAPRPSAAGASAGAAKGPATGATPARKGVLKRVSFADEVQSQEYDASDPATPSQGATEEEGSKASSPVKEGTKNEKAAALEDVGDDEGNEKTPLLEKAGGEADEGGEKTSVKASEKPVEPKLKPVDVSSDLRSSLARLASALRADTSASSIGAPIVSDVVVVPPLSSTAARVADEEDEEEEVEDEADLEDSSDELEFDPFAPVPSSSKKGGKKKHSPGNSGSGYRSSSSGLAAGSERRSATSLTSSLTALSAAIHTQAIQANATSSFGFSSLSSSATAPSPASSKGPDAAQVKADIRSLKGLLLSRRNFPATGSFARPATPLGMPGGAASATTGAA